MRKNFGVSGKLVATLLLAACGVSSPDAEIDDVDVLFARVCELAAPCPGTSATQQEIDDCPLGIRTELSEIQLNELEQFTSYTQSKQVCVLECMGGALCDRFDGALSNISDSDVLEPFRTCEQECPVGT